GPLGVLAAEEREGVRLLERHPLAVVLFPPRLELVELGEVAARRSDEQGSHRVHHRWDLLGGRGFGGEGARHGLHRAAREDPYAARYGVFIRRRAGRALPRPVAVGGDPPLSSPATPTSGTTATVLMDLWWWELGRAHAHSLRMRVRGLDPRRAGRPRHRHPRRRGADRGPRHLDAPEGHRRRRGGPEELGRRRQAARPERRPGAGRRGAEGRPGGGRQGRRRLRRRQRDRHGGGGQRQRRAALRRRSGPEVLGGGGQGLRRPPREEHRLRPGLVHGPSRRRHDARPRTGGEEARTRRRAGSGGQVPVGVGDVHGPRRGLRHRRPLRRLVPTRLDRPAAEGGAPHHHDHGQGRGRPGDDVDHGGRAGHDVHHDEGEVHDADDRQGGHREGGEGGGHDDDHREADGEGGGDDHDDRRVEVDDHDDRKIAHSDDDRPKSDDHDDLGGALLCAGRPGRIGRLTSASMATDPFAAVPYSIVAGVDPELADIVARELARQNTTIQLIASENFTSPAVMAAQGTVLTNKYSEGYPGKRYYGGNYVVDDAE